MNHYETASTVSASSHYSRRRVTPETVLEKQQEWDAAVMAAIWKKRKILDPAEVNKLKHLYDNAKKNHRYNTSIIKYSYSDSLAGARKYGRLYSIEGGIERIEKTIRQSLCANLYWDIDIVNAQPTLLAQIGAKYGVKLRHLTYYVENRDEVIQRFMKHYNMSRDDVKDWIIKCLFGCAIPELKSLQTELESLASVLQDVYEELYSIVERMKDKNVDGSFLSYVAQTEECRCLLAMNEFFESHERRVDVLCYDGCMIRKLEEGESTFPTELLTECEAYVKEKTGYSIALAIKPMTISPDFKPKSSLYALTPAEVSDTYMTKQFIAYMGAMMKCDTNEGLILYNESTGLWTKDTTYIRYKISCANLVEDTIDGLVDYSNYVYKQDLIIKLVPSFIPTENFVYSAIYKSTGKLLFNDGIFDITKKEFCPEFDHTIYFPFKIERNFPKERDEGLISIVNKMLFLDPFLEAEAEVGSYLKKLIARGIAGFYEDKSVVLAVGEPDCGKGVLSEALERTFCGYVGAFNANSLLLSKYSSNDAAKKLSWLLPLQYCRLICSNEISKGSVLDSNLFKQIFSGGDTLMARSNFKDEVQIKNRATGILFCNDIAKFYPLDDAVCNRAKIIEYKLSFVDNPIVQNQRKAEEGIKELFSNNIHYKDAFFWVIMDAFEKRKPTPGTHSLAAAQEWLPRPTSSLNEVLATLGFIIDLSNNEYFTPFREIKQALEEAKAINGMSDIKIGKELEKLGLTQHCKKINGISIKGRLFIKRETSPPPSL